MNKIVRGLLSVGMVCALISPSVYFYQKNTELESRISSVSSEAYHDGHSEGYDDGYQVGKKNGYKEGYDTASREGIAALSDAREEWTKDSIRAAMREDGYVPAYDDDDYSTYCYISYGGKKYHRSPSCAGSEPRKVTVAEAKEQGRDACAKCW